MGGLFAELEWRGLVHQVTDPDLGRRLDENSLTFYIGFDPTSDSLHVGNLLQLTNIRRLQRAGHEAIAIIGGGTGMIGDPSFRDEERRLLSSGELEANGAAMRRQLESLLDDGTRFVDNADWLRQLPLTDFLRDVGKHFSVNEMIRKESVKARLDAREQGISFTEFSYMLLQAYDFLHLFDAFGCRLQLGGSDQWGNITEGVDLIRRVRGEQAYGLTSPLITLPTGQKMGKSETGTRRVWLDPNQTSPYQFFQYWVRADDQRVGQYLRFFTSLPRDRIEELDACVAHEPERREAQRVLAREMTAMVHGEDEAERAERAAAALYSEEIAELDEAALLDVVAEAPSITVPRAPVGLVEALVTVGLASSASDARRAIQQGGAYVNNRREADLQRALMPEDALHGKYLVLRKGKRDYAVVRFEA